MTPVSVLVTTLGSLQFTRVGDYLTIQERGTNDFGMYVVDRAAVQIIDDQTIREFWLKVFHNRASGNTVVNASRCQITSSRPVYTIVQDEEPVVSSRGVLWYREVDDVLSISNYGSGMTGVGGPQWTEINGGPEANPNDYLKLTGGTMQGSIAMSERQIKELGDPISDTDAVNKRWLKGWTNQELGLYLPLAGGQMKGELAMGGHKVTGMGDPTADAQAANKRYVDTRLKKTAGTTEKLEGDLYLGQHKICGLGAPERSDDAATKKFVQDQISEIVFPEAVGGGQFIKEFNHGYAPIQGSPTAPISKSQVAFLNSSGDATKVMAAIGQVLLPWEFINPEWITGTGVIKIAPEEQPDRINGYLTVYDFFVNEGKNVTLIAEVGKYGPNTSEISYGKRHLLTFNGVFFGDYDPFWNPER